MLRLISAHSLGGMVKATIGKNGARAGATSARSHVGPYVDNLEHMGVVAVSGVGYVLVDDADSLAVAETLMKLLRERVMRPKRAGGKRNT